MLVQSRSKRVELCVASEKLAVVTLLRMKAQNAKVKFIVERIGNFDVEFEN